MAKLKAKWLYLNATDLEDDGNGNLRLVVPSEILRDAETNAVCLLYQGSVTGNARGAGAVELSPTRDAAAQVASGANSIAIGGKTKAPSAQGVAIGYLASVSSLLPGQLVLHSGGQFAAQGDLRHARMQMHRTIASTAETELRLADGTSKAVLSAGSTWSVMINIVARQASGASGGALYHCVIQRTADSTTMLKAAEALGTPYWNGIGTPSIAITADDTYEALRITVAQANSTSTRWLAALDWTEIGY